MSRLKKKFASLASVFVAAPLLMVGAASAAHADGAVTWETNTAMAGCLGYGVDQNGVNQNNLFVWSNCNDPGLFRSVNFYDVDEGSGQWLEKPSSDTSLCMTAYWDHSVYFEGCKNGGAGNSYERWYEINRDGNWYLQNVATGEYLNSDSNGNVYTSDFQQIWH